MSAASTKSGLLICSDLFFTSKVTGTAQALGLQVVAVDDIATAAAHLQNGEIGFVLLDLAVPQATVPDLIAVMPTSARRPVLAFGSHVNVEQLDAARAAGAEVLPRSQFSARLAEILQRMSRS
jgi:DNA-binding NtrC family response regulator